MVEAPYVNRKTKQLFENRRSGQLLPSTPLSYPFSGTNSRLKTCFTQGRFWNCQVCSLYGPGAVNDWDDAA